MSPEELAPLKSLVAGFGAGAIASAGISYLLVKFFVSSYLSEKGKNLATHEDIAAITDKIEGVRAQYTALAEELKARHQLRLAAVDRRLQAHQEAFALWRRLLTVVHTDEVGSIVVECQSWWEQNCIYLEATVREAFVNAYSSAHGHNALIRSRSDVPDIKESWASIIAFPNVLFKAIQLPALSELEAKALGVSAEATR